MRFSIALFIATVASVTAKSPLMDSSGSLRLNMPNLSTGNGVVSVISSPGTSSYLQSSDELLSLESENPPCLSCRGATLSGTSSLERSALATSSLVSGAILMDGITLGDVEAGWRNSRHSRTLTALFRARLAFAATGSKQAIILCVKGELDSDTESTLKSEVESLFDATSVEIEGKQSFSDFYTVAVIAVTNKSEADEVRFSVHPSVLYEERIVFSSSICRHLNLQSLPPPKTLTKRPPLPMHWNKPTKKSKNRELPPLPLTRHTLLKPLSLLEMHTRSSLVPHDPNLLPGRVAPLVVYRWMDSDLRLNLCELASLEALTRKPLLPLVCPL